METKRLLKILTGLEKEPLSTDMITARLNSSGFIVTERTVQRDLNERLTQKGLQLRHKSRNYAIEVNDSYYKFLASFFHDFFENYMRTFCTRDITTTAIYTGISHLKTPATLVANLYGALQDSREISFLYKPQTRDTVEKLACKKAEYASGLPIKMIPHGFVFSRESLLIGGENGYFSEPEYRHYDLRGIDEIEVGDVFEKRLKINLEKEYENSVDIWHGGTLYPLLIRETPPAEPGKARTYEKLVNGEKEILAQVHASDGRLKIINPPPGIVKKAREMQYPDSIFLYE